MEAAFRTSASSNGLAEASPATPSEPRSRESTTPPQSTSRPSHARLTKFAFTSFASWRAVSRIPPRPLSAVSESFAGADCADIENAEVRSPGLSQSLGVVPTPPRRRAEPPDRPRSPPPPPLEATQPSIASLTSLSSTYRTVRRGPLDASPYVPNRRHVPCRGSPEHSRPYAITPATPSRAQKWPRNTLDSAFSRPLGRPRRPLGGPLTGSRTSRRGSAGAFSRSRPSLATSRRPIATVESVSEGPSRGAWGEKVGFDLPPRGLREGVGGLVGTSGRGPRTSSRLSNGPSGVLRGLRAVSIGPLGG